MDPAAALAAVGEAQRQATLAIARLAQADPHPWAGPAARGYDDARDAALASAHALQRDLARVADRVGAFVAECRTWGVS